MKNNIFFRLDVRLRLMVFFGFIMLLFVINIAYSTKKSYRENLDFEFNGKVEFVSYDVKGTPTIKINKQEYCLTYNNWDFDHQIEKGDSLDKRKGTFVIKLIKFNSKSIVYFGK